MTAQILIAVSVIDGTTFAVERVRAGAYALCPLHDWINIETLDDKPTKRPKYIKDESREKCAENAPWWDRAAVSRLAPAKLSHSLTSMPQLSMKPALVENISTPRALPDEPSAAATMPQQGASHEHALQGEEEVAATPDAILAALRTKYLETLYISKTSLAYFAKGPLARARNLLKRANARSPTQGLLELLQDMILTVSMNDKKYAAALPEFVKEVPATAIDDDTETKKQTETMCKRGKRRKKVSNGGLFPCEEDYVLQWWLEREGSSESLACDDTLAQRIRSGLAKQRTRETQLQIMLILEAMIAENAESETVGPTEVTTDMLEQAKSPGKNKPKRKNLQSLLEMHIDRLCIWQTTQNGFDTDSPTLRPKSSHGEKVNALQDFCTEALVPFFASRIPKVFAQICRKMGTVGASSPLRPTLRKVASTSQAHPKPGAAVSRSGLQRVATEGSMSARKTPGLSRSATHTSITSFKREGSEINLDDIPAHKPRVTPVDQLRRREVDVDALTKATEAKLKRRALLEQELQGAINVVRKPNSRMAVKEFVESTDVRTATKLKRKREPIQTVPAPSLGPQVKATPRKYRRTGPAHTEGSSNLRDAIVPPSSDPRIPSSSHRPAVPQIREDYTTVESSYIVQVSPLKPLPEGFDGRHSSALDATPSKKRVRQHGRLDPTLLVEDSLDVSPVASRTVRAIHAMAHTPTKPNSRYLMPPARSLDLVAGTPVKAVKNLETPSGVLDYDTNSMSNGAVPALVQGEPKVMEEEEVDIYKALGWDDEVDLL